MEEGDVRGARAGPAQMVENMRTKPKGLPPRQKLAQRYYTFQNNFFFTLADRYFPL